MVTLCALVVLVLVGVGAYAVADPAAPIDPESRDAWEEWIE